MAQFERVTLFAILEFDYIAPAGATALLLTDLPGNAVAVRETLAIPASATRRTVKLRLKGTTKGKKYQVKLTSGGTVILFGGKVYARQLGLGAEWAWVPLPIDPTADTWSNVKLPIEATADTFRNVKLPISPTADEWTNVKIPMNPTADLFSWADVPVSK